MADQKKLGHGIMMAGVYTALFLLFNAVPVFNMVVLFVLPLPVVYYTGKFGMKSGLILTGLLAAVGFLLTLDVFMAISFVVIGFVLGALTYKQASGTDRFVYTGMTVFLLVISVYLLFLATTNFSLSALFRESFDQSARMLEEIGLSTFEKEDVETYLAIIEAMATFWLLLFSYIYAWILYGFASLLYKRVDITYNQLPAFREWQFPSILLLFYIVLLLIAFSDPDPGSLLFMIHHSGKAIISVLLVLQGMALLVAYVQSKRQSAQLKAAWIIGLVIGVMLFPISFLVLRMVGVFDMVFKLRERWQT